MTHRVSFTITSRKERETDFAIFFPSGGRDFSSIKVNSKFQAVLICLYLLKR